MTKISKVDSRLVARAQHRQVEALARLETLSKSHDRIFAQALSDLARFLASGKSGQLLAYSAIMDKAISKAIESTEWNFERLIDEQHRWVVDSLIRSVPAKVWLYLVPIELRREWVEQQPTGRLIFDSNGLHIVYEDDRYFGVPVRQLQQVELTDQEKLEAIAKVLFPSPTQLQVKKILARKMRDGRGESLGWRERFDRLSRLIHDKKIAFNEIAQAFSEGESVRGIRQRLEPVVSGIRASAQRIARTEGMRISEQMQRRAWDGLGDMMTGAQVVAVLDENTRPEHATRNGTIYYRSPRPGQKSMAELPDLPDEPNCRCMTVPVLTSPEELKDDPAVRESFKLNRHAGSSDPKTYDRWFKKADLRKRQSVVGVKRHRAVEEITGRWPEWSDFIDTEGQLISIADLEAETAIERENRKKQISRLFDLRRRKLGEVSGRGFELPRSKSRRHLSSIKSRGRVRITGDDSQFRRELRGVLPDITARSFARLTGVPAGADVAVSFRKVQTRSNADLTVFDSSYELNREGVSISGFASLVADNSQGGKLTLLKRNIRINPARKGAATDLFYDQVQEARKHRINRIRLLAHRDDSAGDVGYRVWPKLGFNGAIPKELQSEVQAQFPGVKTLAGLLRSKQGRKWWDENGVPVQLEFDSRPNSRSMKRLRKYIKQRGQQMKNNESKATEAQNTSPARHVQTPDLRDEEHQILEKLWDEETKLPEEKLEPAPDWVGEMLQGDYD